jgi:hypothetical protein
VLATELSQKQRARLFDHKLRSSDAAEKILRDLQATEP